MRKRVGVDLPGGNRKRLFEVRRKTVWEGGVEDLWVGGRCAKS